MQVNSLYGFDCPLEEIIAFMPQSGRFQMAAITIERNLKLLGSCVGAAAGGGFEGCVLLQRTLLKIR